MFQSFQVFSLIKAESISNRVLGSDRAEPANRTRIIRLLELHLADVCLVDLNHSQTSIIGSFSQF